MSVIVLLRPGAMLTIAQTVPPEAPPKASLQASDAMLLDDHNDRLTDCGRSIVLSQN